jgi:hypothetical protein
VGNAQRAVDEISIFNRDTANANVVVKIEIGGIDHILARVTLAPDERLHYSASEGFRVFANNGALKQSAVVGTNPITSAKQMVILGGVGVTNNNAVANTIADVTGLSFPVVSGQRYSFKFVIRYSAAAATTGSRWSINGPTFTELGYSSDYSLTTASRTMNEGLGAYDLPAASNASSAATTGSNLAIIEGFIRPSADGVVIARFASEVLSSAIVALPGSYVEFQAI